MVAAFNADADVAFVLFGATARDNGGQHTGCTALSGAGVGACVCSRAGREAQVAASRSQVAALLRPLAALGLRARVFGVTNRCTANWADELSGLYAPFPASFRLYGEHDFGRLCQGAKLEAALDLMAASHTRFDHVLLSRPDVIWRPEAVAEQVRAMVLHRFAFLHWAPAWGLGDGVARVMSDVLISVGRITLAKLRAQCFGSPRCFGRPTGLCGGANLSRSARAPRPLVGAEQGLARVEAAGHFCHVCAQERGIVARGAWAVCNASTSEHRGCATARGSFAPRERNEWFSFADVLAGADAGPRA